MTTSFSFPVASLPEIISVVHEWGLDDVQQSQIASCDPIVIQRIYAVAVQRVTGISLDTLDDKTEQLVQGLDEYGDICPGGISLSLLLYHVQRTCAAARASGVSLKDLVHPERAKTMNILSALINLVKFTEEQQDFVRNLREQSNSAVEERDRLEAEIEQLKDHITRIKAQRAAEEPECEELRANISQMSTHLGTTREIQNRMISEAEKCKREKQLAVERKMAIRNEISLAKEKRDRTRARIVQDPERMRRNLRDKTALCQEERSAISNDESKSRALQAKLDALGVFEQDIRHNVHLLQAAEAEQSQFEEAERKLQDTRGLLEQKNIERSELQGNLEHARRRQETVLDKRERAQKNAEDRQVASKNTITRLQRDFEEMSIERRDNDKQVEETKKQIEDIEKKMAEHLWKNEGEMNELYGQYMRLRHHMDLYMETLANKLGVDLEAAAATA